MISHELRHEYSDGIRNKTVAMLGPVPPPLGGVSVHIERVGNKLLRQDNRVHYFVTTVEYRYRWFAWYLVRLFVWLLWVRPDDLLYHTLYLSNCGAELWLLAHLKKFLRYRLVAIEHDCRHLYLRSAAFKKRFNSFLGAVDELVLIGNITLKSYQDNQIVMPEKTVVEAAFLPPDTDLEKRIFSTYPVSLTRFMQNRSPLIVANAFQPSLVGGKDLYGIDLCIDMLVALKNEHTSIGLVLALATVSDYEYFKRLYFLMHKMQVEEHVYILYQQKELWPLLKRADLFVRPTRSDGASVSVQEALYFGIPTIASDVCLRPQGAIVFEAGNSRDFIKKVDVRLKFYS